MSDFRSVYRWVPSLYVMQGLPYALVTAVSAIFYKSFDFSNPKIAFYTSLFTIPWWFKPALAPAFETLASKRTLTLIMQFLLAGLFFLLAICLQLNNFFYITGLFFFIIALVSSVHDINSDGLYIVALNKQEQTHFIGIRTLFYQLGKLACQGGLVFLAGFLIDYFGKIKSWQISFLLFSALMFMLAGYHRITLPAVEKNIDNSKYNLANTFNSFRNVSREFAHLPNLLSIVIFVLTYNFAEAQLIKIMPLFLLDKINHGGLALSIEQVGTIYGGIGTIGMLMGIILSGFLLTKISLKKCLVPITTFVAITNLGYLLLSYFSFNHIWVVGFFVALAQFGFGLSNGVYMVYLLSIFTKGSYPMSLYAIGTALMGFSMTFGGAISGYIQELLGYTGFFIWILIANLGIVLISIYNVRKIT